MSKTCSKCGALNSETARFCADCAAPLEVACPSCGIVNRAEARFCNNCATPLRGPTPHTGMLSPNSLLAGRYIILRKAGGGGMGAVYQAADQRIAGKLWAVKEMSDAALTTTVERQQAVEAFRREAQLLAMLDHGNLPKVSDFFTEAGKHYLVMDFVQGQTLEQVLVQASGFLPESRVSDWAMQLCDVLAYLHNRQPAVIFRDLKPMNIMLDTDGRIKLIDFGIARAFQPGKSKDTQAMGTPGYAAPEQYGAGQSDARSDIYALGVTLHQLLTRYDPALSPFILPPARNINAALSPAIATVIVQATQVDMTARFQTMAEMKQALMNGPAPAFSPPASLPHTPASGGMIHPYVLAPGLVATTPKELAQMCELDWDRAASQFCSGYFETWLRQAHQYGLADDTQRIVARVKNGDPYERSAGLVEWLALTGHASRGGIGDISDLDCGVVGLGESASVTLRITNAGGGYLLGVVRSQVTWLTIVRPQFACGPHGSAQIGVAINTAKLSPGLVTESKALLIETGTDRKVIGAKANVAPPVLHAQPVSLDCGAIQKEQTWKGAVEITNNGRGILEGAVQSNEAWLSAGAKFRCVANQKERVEVAIDPSRLISDRTYQAQLTVVSNGGTQRIPVTAYITPPPPRLAVTPNDCLILDRNGQGTLHISNQGGGRLRVSADVRGWIAAEARQVPQSSDWTISVKRLPGAPASPYQGQVLIQSNGGGANIEVRRK